MIWILTEDLEGYRLTPIPFFDILLPTCVILLFVMTDEEIRLKFHREGIADKATAAVRERAGGEEALVKMGAAKITLSVLEEVYLMGWKDAGANKEPFDRVTPSPRYKIDRDRIVKPLKEGEIDREAIENAKDIGKFDISVLGLSKSRFRSSLIFRSAYEALKCL